MSLARAAGSALAISAAVAAFDELRQGTSAVREGSAIDVALDLTGAVLAIAALFWVQRLFGRSWIARPDGVASYPRREKDVAREPGR